MCSCEGDDDNDNRNDKNVGEGEGEGEGESEGEGEGDGEGENEGGGELKGDCETDEDCARVPWYGEFLHPENVYCDLVYPNTGRGECRECINDSDCEETGAKCSKQSICILPTYCETARDCISASQALDTREFLHYGCLPEGFCGYCSDDSHCLSEEICFTHKWAEHVEEYGMCIDADKVDQSCIDETCAKKCEICSYSEEGGDFHFGLICPQKKTINP